MLLKKLGPKESLKLQLGPKVLRLQRAPERAQSKVAKESLNFLRSHHRRNHGLPPTFSPVNGRSLLYTITSIPKVQKAVSEGLPLPGNVVVTRDPNVKTELQSIWNSFNINDALTIAMTPKVLLFLFGGTMVTSV